MKIPFAICTLFLSFSLCAQKKAWTNTSQQVPGVTFISNNLAVDRTEITNFHWKEYSTWLKHVYGAQSPDYLAALPDTNVWMNLDSSYIDFRDYYYQHPAYRDFPVVGITYEQAVAYCEWRSDRVFEWLLRRYQLTPKNFPKYNKDSIISIKAYQANQIPGIEKNELVTAYPHYRLPSKVEWESIQQIAQDRYAECSERKKKKILQGFEESNFSKKGPVYVGNTKNQTLILNINTNVSEWLKEKGSIAGQNWRGQVVLDQYDNINEQKSASSAVGFRCVFEWR